MVLANVGSKEEEGELAAEEVKAAVQFALLVELCVEVVAPVQVALFVELRVEVVLVAGIKGTVEVRV